ncbi:MAG: hypothetical protein WDN24_14850 [Sphingomonas sp.]
MHCELSRRGLMGGALLLGGGVMLPVAASAVEVPSHPVIAFHADQLYLDRSGRAEPYAPPAGLRALDGHDAAALRHLIYSL